MHTVDEHAIPTGPLAVRWLAWTLDRLQAGALVRTRVIVENAGSATWRDIKLGHHWLDELGNAIVWDGVRSDAPPLPPGMRAEIIGAVRAPIPPGRYRLALDLVREHRYWLSEIGNTMLELDFDVVPRDATRAVAHVPEGVQVAPDWHERVRALHEEGYEAVGGAIAGLTGYEPGGGRNPAFDRPLVCPSLLPPLEPNCEVDGLPAFRPEGHPPWWFGQPWIYDASITARLRSGRPRG